MNKVLEKYKNMPEPMKASIWFVICSCIQKGISVITVPIFTRILSTSQYGVYSVYQSWYSIILVFTTLNLYAGVFNNGMLKYENDRDGFQSSLVGLSLTCTIVISVIYTIFRDFFTNVLALDSVLVYLMLIEAFCSVGLSFWSARQRFDYKYKILIVVTVILAVLSPVFGIIGVVLASESYKAFARIIVNVGVQVVFGGVLCVVAFKNGKQFYNKEYWKFALNFNLPLIPHYLAQTVLNQADRIMIGNICGTDKAAIYSVAYSSAMLMTIFTQSINNSFVPWTYKAIKSGKYDNIRYISKVLLIIVGGISLILVLFAPELIFILAGEQYAEAVNVIPPVAGAVFFMFLYPLFCNIEFYFEKTKFIMVASSLAAIVNIILNYGTIKIFGYVAAGYTTLICFIIISIAHYVFMKKVCKDNGIPLEIYDIRFIMIFSVIYLVIILTISLTYHMMIIRYVVIFILLLIIFIKRHFFCDIIYKMKK